MRTPQRERVRAISTLMLREVLRRAIKDTRAEKTATIVLAFIGFVFAFGLEWHFLSKEAALGELKFWAIKAVGAAFAVFLLFAWNLACAPYRIERDKNAKLAELLQYAGAADVDTFVRSRSYFTLKEAACLLAGEPMRSGELVGPSAGYLHTLHRMVLKGELVPTNAGKGELAMLRVRETGRLSGLTLDIKQIAHDDWEISGTELSAIAGKMKRRIPSLE
jgi:hypothetical protein